MNIEKRVTMNLKTLYLPEIGVIILFATIFIAYFYAASANMRRKRNWKTLSAAIICSAVQLANISVLIAVFNLRHGATENIWNESPASQALRIFIMVEVVLAGLFLFTAFYASTLRKKAAQTLTSDSIAEAILNLSSGLCFAAADGRVILSNTLIRSQILKITRKPLTDANEAWTDLCNASSGSQTTWTKSLLYRDDDRVWSFQRKELLIDGKEYQQIDSNDVTERVRLMEELQAVNEKKEDQNRRTRELIANIINTKSEQEILDMQSRIHHEVGQCIIMARRYMGESPDSEKLTQLLDLWEQTFRFDLAVNEAQDVSEREREICTAAEICGCSVYFRGERPRSDAGYLLYLAAAREAVTNAIRHAAATEVYIDGARHNDELLIVIKDNSGVTVENMTEGVGLSVLRKKLETAGIRLDIDTNNGVHLILSFPGEVKK